MYKVNGKDYGSISALARAHNLKPTTVVGRINRGIPVSESLFKPIHSNSFCGFSQTYNGVDYPSMASLCSAYGVNQSTISRLINDGKTLDESIKHCLALKEKKPRVIYVDDKPYPSFISIEREYGVSSSSLIRIADNFHINSKDIEAIIKNRDRYKIPVIYNGEEYESLVDLIKKTGNKYSAVKYRLSTGWTLEEAISGERVSNR